MDLGYKLIVVTAQKESYRIHYVKRTGAEGTIELADLRRVHKWIEEHCDYGNVKVIWN